MPRRRILGTVVGVAMVTLTACGSATATPPVQAPRTETQSARPAAVTWVGETGWANESPGTVAGVPGGGVAVGTGSMVGVEEGGTWHWATFPTAVEVSRVVFTSPSAGLVYAQAVGASETVMQVYQTTNGGTTWRLVEQADPAALPAPVERITTVDGVFYAVDAPGWTFMPQAIDAMVSRDGLHWTRWAGLPAPFVPTAVMAGPGGQVWMAGLWASGGALVSGTPGHWSVILRTPMPLYDMAFLGSTGMAVGGTTGIAGLAGPAPSQAVYVTIDGGATWRLASLRSGAPAPFSRVFMPAPHMAYALAGVVPTGANGPGYRGLWRSDDGGATWMPVLTTPLAGAWATSPTDVVAETRNGVLWQTNDAGTTWTPVDPQWWPALWATFVSPRQGFAAVDTGLGHLLIQTDNGGATWSVLRSLGASTPVWWFSPPEGLLLTSAGTLVWTSGRRQVAGSLPAGGLLPESVAFVTPRRGWMVANGTLFMTQDGGLRWVGVRQPVPNLVAVAVGPGHRLAVVDATGRWAWTDGSDQRWHAGTLPGAAVGVETLAWAPAGALWVAGWQNENNGTSVPRLWVVVPGRSTETLMTALTPAGLGFVGADGWAYTLEGGLFLTRDGGRIWRHTPLHIVGSLVQSGTGP
jgi:hypothetical protein